ncbi:MAG: 50S ribosomal protein L18e [Candidatus Woesearchaeota archaeon]|nr:50S ribosomal protein L18e [Candidatus Woesearchaeota archaeon]
MAKRTGPTNVQLKALIEFLRMQAVEHKADIWKRIADDLERPTRKRRIVNLYKLDKFTKENENVVVPGKVLGGGIITHKINVAAFSFSEGAKQKILNAKGTCIEIPEMVKKSPKGHNVRIIG